LVRSFPDLKLSACPASYARYLVQGYDTVQEAFWLIPSPAFIGLLDSAKAAAIALGDNLEATVEIDLGGHRFKVHATGAKGGFRWRLSDDDLIIFVGSPKRDWTISCRYLSAGLWEHGLAPLRARALKALRAYTTQPDLDCVRVTRADWCFDFYSPAFTQEFVPGLAGNVICHSSAKTQERGSTGTFNRGGHGETLSMGSKAGLQNQLYNKTLEIDEASGKTWLYALWLNALNGERVFGDSKKPCDVWRLECRMSSSFLKERNIRRPAELESNLAALVAEALYTRRLSSPPMTPPCPHCGETKIADDNRWRWPLHPLFSEALRQFSARAMLPIGRKVTGRRAQLVNRALASVGGSLLAYGVLEKGTASDAHVISFMQRAIKHALDDPKRAEKELRSQSRYSDVDDAR
jgi:hypothetical protein